MKQFFLISALVLLATFQVLAHDPGLSGASAKLQAGKLELTLSLANRDACQLVQLDADGDGLVTTVEFSRGREHLAAVIGQQCELRLDGVPVKPDGLACQQDDAKNVSAQLGFSNVSAHTLEFNFPIFRSLPFGHRMFFSFEASSGQAATERLLTANDNSIIIQFDGAASAPTQQPAPPLANFILMGLEHIGTGYDHLLFLFALLVVTRTFRSALVVITAFTLAHTITLAVATFNWVTISPNLTEPAIALTIVYVGLENLWRHGDPHRRWLLTFSFGLIHGFGFASALREAGVGARAGGVVLPLFGFNLGVELGQLTIAAIALPLIWRLRQNEKILRLGVPTCSVAVALAGGFWFVQRVWFK